MIALLSYSTNLLGKSNETISSTGGLKEDSLCNDSVLISYCDLRIVNSKLIELDYEKEINKNLRTIVYNDSIAVYNHRKSIDAIQKDCDKRVKKVKKDRDLLGLIGFCSTILLILSLLK